MLAISQRSKRLHVIKIQEETGACLSDIRKINEAAFGDSLVSNLVGALRSNKKVDLSLIAEVDNGIVGHIMFSPVFVEGAECSKRGTALAPVAVLPKHQRTGVGSALINEGLKRCRNLGIDYVVLLGHRIYYPRFGFEPIRNHGLTTSYGNGEHAMVHELTEGALNMLLGKICYQPEFKENGC
jgi:putative acetyltransferase